MEHLPLLASGLVGSFAAELAGWFKIRQELHRGLPNWSRTPWYWLVTGLMVLMGPFLVWLYVRSGLELSPLLAFNIGASAPLVIERLTQTVPPVDPGRAN